MGNATEKSPARRAADARYEAARRPVLVRLTRAEADEIDAVRGGVSLPSFLRAAGLRAAKQKKGRGA